MSDPDKRADDCDSAWARRMSNKANGDCINETRAKTHGKATHGVLCLRCRLTHRHGALTATRMLATEAQE